MAKDIIARLKADTGQWDSGFSRAGKTLSNFQRQNMTMNGVLESGLKTITKLSAGYVGFQGAMAAFNKTIASSQTLTDGWNTATRAVSSSVDYLFHSIAMGSFDGFIDGLKDVISNAKEAYNSLDQLGTFMVYNGKVTSEFDKRRSQYRANIRNGVDVEANKKALKQLEAEEKKYYGEQSRLMKQSGVDLLVEKTGSRRGSGWLTPYLDYYTGQARALKEAERLEREGKKNMVNYYASGTSDKVNALRRFGQLGDDELREILSYYEGANRAQQRVTDLSAADARLMKAGKSGGGKKSAGGGRISGLNMKDIQGMAFGFTGDQVADAWAEIWKTVARQQDQDKSLALADGTTANIEKRINETIQGIEIDPIMLEVDTKTAEEHAKKFGELVNNEMMLEDVKDVASGLSQAFNSASSSLGQFASQSKQAAAASKAFSIAGAIAQLAAQFAAIPKGAEIWSWIAGTVAGTGALVASVASLKKMGSGSFAAGGVVPGQYNGGMDNTFVYASPGELILNRAQQNNLAGQLAGVGGGATVTLRGEDMILQINNTAKRMGLGSLKFG